MSQIQAGRYTATITAASVSESKTKGTPGVFFTVSIEGSGSMEGQMWLSEKAFERTVQTLRECFGFDDNFDTIEGQLVGKECSITIEDEIDDKGKAWARIKWVNPVREPAKAVAGDFLAQLSAKAARLTRSAPPAATPPPPVKKDGDPF